MSFFSSWGWEVQIFHPLTTCHHFYIDGSKPFSCIGFSGTDLAPGEAATERDKNKILAGYLHECRKYLFPQGFNGDCRAWNEDKSTSTLRRGVSNSSVPPPFTSLGSRYMGLVRSFLLSMTSTFFSENPPLDFLN